MSRRLHGTWLAVLAVLALLLLGQNFVLRSTKSATTDEAKYLKGAKSLFWEGDLHWLSRRGVAPLPIEISYLSLAADRQPGSHESALALGEDWSVALDPERISRARAAHSLLVGLPLLVLVFVWLLRRQGLVAASLGGALLVFSPTVVAHSSLATTDASAALSVLVTLALAAAYWRRIGRARLAAMSVALGLAISAKYSGLILIPLVAWVTARGRLRESRGNGRENAAGRIERMWLDAAATLFSMLLIVAVVVVITHGFDLHGLLEGIRFQIQHARGGHPAFLLGATSSHGWWFYFPVAFLVKSTPSELFLAAALPVLAIASRARMARRPDDASPWLWMITMFCFGAAAIASPINIGHRYILVLYPLLILSSVELLAELLRRRPRLWVTLASGLALAQMASSLLVAPHWIAYFNAFAGGPSKGHAVLLDSNIDWGQDLPGLAVELEEMGCARPVLDVSVQVRPESYGVEGETRELVGARLDGYDCLAASVTRLHDVYRKRPGYSSLRRLPPAGRAGYSIWIYDLDDPAVRAALGLGPR